MDRVEELFMELSGGSESISVDVTLPKVEKFQRPTHERERVPKIYSNIYHLINMGYVMVLVKL